MNKSQWQRSVREAPLFASLAGAALATLSAMPQPAAPIIADRAEFVDVLRSLRAGRVLVQHGESVGSCLLDGAMVISSFEPLSRFGLLDEIPQPPHLPHAHCYRLSPRGHAFARRVCHEWRRRPLWQRLVVRITG